MLVTLCCSCSYLHAITHTKALTSSLRHISLVLPFSLHKPDLYRYLGGSATRRQRLHDEQLSHRAHRRPRHPPDASSTHPPATNTRNPRAQQFCTLCISDLHMFYIRAGFDSGCVCVCVCVCHTPYVCVCACVCVCVCVCAIPLRCTYNKICMYHGTSMCNMLLSHVG